MTTPQPKPARSRSAGRRTGRVTRSEVARAAGVSLAVVTDALTSGDKLRISKGTRQRVQKIAARQGYRPPLHASIAPTWDRGYSSTNWTAGLRATDVTIWNNGNLTHAPVDTNAAPGITNRVSIVAQDLTLHAGGKIDVSSRGFRGGIGAQVGQGPGGGIFSGGHGGPAGHGGMGGTGGRTPGGIYGAIVAPDMPGSGGGAASSTAGSGGGVARIEATGRVRIDGAILAHGGNGAGQWVAGPGSGGSVWIACRSLDGRGMIRAIGGNGEIGWMGGGGGGRVAIHYDSAEQAALESQPTVSVSVLGGSGFGRYGQMGSIYYPDVSIFDPIVYMT